MKDSVFVELCKSGDVEKFKVALMNGVNANADDVREALMYTAIDDYIEVAELLLKHSADVNARDNKDNTALMWAIRHSKTEFAELLRSYGAK